MNKLLNIIFSHVTVTSLLVIIALALSLFMTCSRLDSERKKNFILEQDYEALVKNSEDNNKELYDLQLKYDDLLYRFPEMEHLIDSLKKHKIVEVKNVEVEKFHYKTDTVRIEIKDTVDFDECFKDGCIWNYIAYKNGTLSLVTEIGGTIYIFHTQEKELINPSKSQFINWFKLRLCRKKTYNKTRIVDNCGILKDVEVIDIIEQ